ncbi:hypothetical protein MAUB1S_01454 [Mycolicibacterium aubagnense]
MDLRAIGKGLGTLDREVFAAIAESPSPLLDGAMPGLTRAADYSKLWFAIAVAMGAVGSQSARRGAARGVVSLAVTSLVTNQLAKRNLAAAATRPQSDSAHPADEARPHLELLAVRALRKRRGLRGGRRP